MPLTTKKDPALHNVINKPEYAETMKELKALYGKLRKDYQVPEGFPGLPANWPSSRSGTALPQRLTPPFTVPPETGYPEHAIDDGGTGFKSSRKQQPFTIRTA